MDAYPRKQRGIHSPPPQYQPAYSKGKQLHGIIESNETQQQSVTSAMGQQNAQETFSMEQQDTFQYQQQVGPIMAPNGQLLYPSGSGNFIQVQANPQYYQGQYLPPQPRKQGRSKHAGGKKGKKDASLEHGDHSVIQHITSHSSHVSDGAPDQQYLPPRPGTQVISKQPSHTGSKKPDASLVQQYQTY